MTRPCALYRHFDATGRLLYVGISLSAAARASQHRAAPWFADMATMTTEWLPTRSAAAAAEQEAIRREQPLHNAKRYGGEPPRDLYEEIPILSCSQSMVIALGSPKRRRMFAEGKLKPLDRERWAAGGYGPDPFGIAARADRVPT